MATLTTISDGTVSATITSDGAELMSLRLGEGEYLWQGDEKFWPRRAPILFPIVGVLRDGRAVSEQGPVTLGRHGLARDYDHAIVEQTPTSVTYELDSSDETRARYPYDFRLNMTYAIVDGSLAQTFKVTNTGDVVMPFTFGGHPAFNVPVPGEEGASFSDYELVFPKAWTARVPRIDEAGMHDFSHMTELFCDSDRMRLSHERIAELLTIVMLEVPGRSVRLEGPAGHGVEVGFDGFDFLGVWTASEDAPFLAIEPWIGCATAYDESDVFEEKRGTVKLEPGASFERTFTMRPF
ncbi:aldose 1-epimerase family protein [Olsenella sp. An293]|uniref:aldose 1-epimerase family protein n=1 Tax=Olsenella sp. An293 TaxID=1965626 RepID=UPI000B373DE6|nr:aldose 1-epimerase family protein [Olsenella sp. An293]OUO32735.1 aldose epimerase [Olsenella sp. An293]